jgi:hypothetical protein
MNNKNRLRAIFWFSTGEKIRRLLRCDYMSQRSDLEQSIVRTLCWFSLLSYPVTVFEIWKWLLQPQRPYDLSEVSMVLENSEWLKSKLQHAQGFYVLKGGDISKMIRQRQIRFTDSEKKYRALRRVTKFFSILPAVRAVSAVNTLAWWSTTDTSDIDLYIVTKPGFLWSTRFWLVLPFLLTGNRPHHAEGEGHSGKHPFCFSFFSTSEAMQMEGVCYERDVYMAFWAKSVVSIMDRDQCFENFHRLNRWATKLLPNSSGRVAHPYHHVNPLLSLPVQFSITEQLFAFVQKRRMPDSLTKMANIDSRVVLTDKMLKFHEHDRRLQFRDSFEELISRHI